MTDRDLRQHYAALLAESRPRSRAECVPTESLAAIVSGDAPEVDRLEWLRHVGGCVACQEDLNLLRGTMFAGRRLQARRFAGLAAAAAILLLAGAGVVFLRRDRLPIARVTRNAGETLGMIAPRGDVPPPAGRSFKWQGAGAVVQYDFELLNDAGDAVFRASTRDTVLTLPDSINLASRQTFLWWVLARRLDGTEIRSPLQAFRLITK